jgi:acyl-CoA thioesterase FadM
MLEDDQITLQKFNDWKRWPILAHVEGTFLKPTYLNHKILSRAQVVEHGRTHFTVAAEFTVEGTPVFRGKARVVMVNEKGRPDTIPPEMMTQWDYTE